ncbi:MAG: sugar ABC transporter permease [Actinobacteria bacterium]|nr:sugar ABC transporter permease [Cyanobacteriota bacterium]MCL5771037.1 sugar ABC transporter permease [Actinomycetota bacterium]
MLTKKRTIWDSRRGLLLILPGILFFSLFFLYPIIYSVKLSLTDASFFNLIKGPEFIGLKNYKELIFEAKFFLPLLKTFLFILTSVPLKIIFALILSAFFNLKLVKLKQILYPVILIPWALPWFLSVMVWRGMLNVDFGIINQILQKVGLPAVNWLNGVWTSFLTYNIVEVWLTYPFVMSVILSAMQSIPDKLYESAKMDGANEWNSFKFITLPMLKKSLIWVTLIQIMASYMIFGVPFLLNKGGPARINEFLMIYGYQEAFSQGRYGYAAAFMVLVFFILSLLVFLYAKITKVNEEN